MFHRVKIAISTKFYLYGYVILIPHVNYIRLCPGKKPHCQSKISGFFFLFFYVRKRVKIAFELCKIDHLYLLFYFGIKNALVVILRDHIYPQELTPHNFIDLASHVGLILPPNYCQLGCITKELDL